MPTISVFEDKHSFLNGLLPRTKLLYMLTACFAPVCLGIPQVYFCTILMSVILLAISHILTKAKTALSVSLCIVVTIFIVQTFFRSGEYTELFSIGFLHARKEGFEIARGIVLNVINITLAGCVFALSTRPSDMMQDWVHAGFSPRIGYVFVSLFQVIPQMSARTRVIQEAQASRGMRTNGNLLARAKAFFPLLSPVIMSSFMDAKERAIALDVRGFSSRAQRTFICPFVPKANDRYMRAFLLCADVCVCVVLLARIVGWCVW